ncbi:hypothetical protein GCM10010174_55610 [Kutzneria viridogrisea]|uniref:Uncharacterized protein n=2 Tax=Kutzneria TaxID=43356 RepID=A0ABR6BKP6_9PSEU|nr:hypothetical protein [Kutzneria albida]AHH95174.1 putative membrane protein [Kutzneria albida DSM 43870]MBA8927469.1 hypothetical protein [Kutzneria viridogrisea]
MQGRRRELVRLWQVAVRRPRWQLFAAALLSLWTLFWIVGQVQQDGRSPLDVLRLGLGWADVPSRWLDAITQWLRDERRHGPLGALAIAGGLLWSSTTERNQLPALLGWLAVMTAAEGIGYGSAVNRAVLALGAFVLVLLLVSLPGRRAFVLRHIVLMPRDVLHAGVTAAALSAVVPLIAPGLVLVRLCVPYVTRPPRPLGNGPHPSGGRPLTKPEPHGVVDP